MLVVPSPKLQAQPVTLPVVASVNATVSGAVPLVGVIVKFATGAGGVTLIGVDAVLVELPPGPVAVSFTV